MRRSLLLVLVVGLMAGLAACGGSPSADVKTDIRGVVFERAPGRGHTEGPVDYPKHPPSGGDHNPYWLNCGFYDIPVPDENAVHSLEHGAVWLTYAESTSPTDLAIIRRLVRDGGGKVLASPYPDLTHPLVIVSWEHRLAVDSVDDPRVAEYIDEFRDSRAAPEAGGACEGAVGQPLDVR